ncbi:MAG: rhodanese-like domain-containing protein [Flavipsychrobacter sp.]
MEGIDRRITVRNITALELKEWMSVERSFVLIDVREGWEREVCNIGGAHIPLSEVLERLHEIPVDIATVIYCEKGMRSSIIIQRLQALGFHNLYNLSGGIAAWKAGLN